MPPDTSIFGRLLANYLALFALGYGHTIDHALWLLQTMVTLEVVILGLTWALREDSIAGVVMSKVLVFSTLVWLLTSWPVLMRAFIDSCIQWGITAGGGGITVQDFRSPGNIFTWGVGLFVTLLQGTMEITGLTDLPKALLMGFVTINLGFFILLGFAVLTVQIAIALVEFYLGATVCIFLLPFGAFRPVAFLAEKAIGYVIASGVKLAILSFITSVAQPALDLVKLTPGGSLTSLATVQEVVALALAVGFMVYLAWKGPAFVGGLLGGGPALSASSALQTVVSAGATAALALGGAGMAVRGGMGAVAAGRAVAAAYQVGGMAGVRTLVGSASRNLAANTLARFTQSSPGVARQVRQAIPHDQGYHGGLSGRL